MYFIALNLICQYAKISVPAPTKGHEIFRILLRDVLRSIITFTGGFEDFTLKRKSMFLIIDIGTDLSHISLDVYKYDSDLDAMLPLALKSVS